MSRGPIPAHAGSRVGHSGWWVLADDDQRPLVPGAFDTMAEAAEIAEAISAGRPWRYRADTRQDEVERGYLNG